MKKAVVYYKFVDDFYQTLKRKYRSLDLTLCRTAAETLDNIADAEILIAFGCNRRMLEQAQALKWIQVLSSGVDELPLEYIRARGLILTNTRGIHKQHMAEYALWAMISLARNTQIIFRNQLQGVWDRTVTQGQISGSTVGILGLGSIGQEIAKMAAALGMRVIGVKNRPEPLEHVAEVYGQEDLNEVFVKSDYVINLLPHTPKTTKLLDQRFFSQMKKTACFINMGRGGTVNETDLADALREGKIRALISDVFADEPLPKDSPFWRLKNVVITPHVCGLSRQYGEKALPIIEHNLDAYLGGGELINVVDLERGY